MKPIKRIPAPFKLDPALIKDVKDLYKDCGYSCANHFVEAAIKHKVKIEKRKAQK